MDLATFSDGSVFEPSEYEYERPIYTIGKTGSGKSTFLANHALKLIHRGESVVVIDPHGSLAAQLIDCIPPKRQNDVCYLDLFSNSDLVGFNPFLHQNNKPLSAVNILSAFKANWWPTDNYPTTEIVFFHILFALLHQPNPTLSDVSDLLTNNVTRKRITTTLDDPQAIKFWDTIYPNFTQKDKQDVARSIMNKLGQFLAFPAIRNTISQKSPRLDLHDIQDQNLILIANLSKGTVGEHNTYLLGSLLISHIFATALSKFDPSPYYKPKPLYLIVDEYPSFGTVIFNPILSEARKYGLRLTLAHQFSQQLSDHAKAAIISNASTFLVLKVSPDDATWLAPLFNDLTTNFEIALTGQDPFHAWIKRDFHNFQGLAEMSPPLPLHTGRTAAVTERSRRRFARKF